MNYYILNNASRASNYGIGTYVKQLTSALRMIPDITITIIDLFSDVREFTITTPFEDGICHFQFPQCPLGAIESEAYCRSVFCILAFKINDFTNTVFQFNYFQHYPLAFAIKAHFPNTRILFVIHYFNWCFELKGNVSSFRKIINGGGELSEKGKLVREVKEDYQRTKEFLHLADSIVVLSDFGRQLLIKDYGISKDKISLVYNGVVAKTSEEPKNITVNQTSLRKSKSLLYVGRLDEIKGVDYLIKAFSKLLMRDGSLRLYIVGDGNFNPLLSLCDGFWDKVTFTGRIGKKEMSSILNSVCLGVLPSFHEQCSYSAIEFMQHGIPFIGTDSTGLSEMLDDVPEFRVHIDEDNFDGEKFTDDLAMVISNIISDQNLLNLGSNKMLRLFAKRYTISSMASGMKKVIANVNQLPALSVEYLFELDKEMFGYIDTRPDIDLDFYGMAGIGAYLWWRLTGESCPSDASYRLRLQEYLFCYLDWVYSAALNLRISSCCNELKTTLLGMQRLNFYITRVRSIMDMFNIADSISSNQSELDAESIMQNAMKIANTKV